MNVSMTPAQMRCFDELLAIGGARPVTPPDLAMRLRAVIEAGTAPVLDAWTERSLWFGKSHLAAVLRCEGNVVANRLEPGGRSGTGPIATGQITHRAIQLSHTHPGRTVDEYVKLAVAGCMSEQGFADFWNTTTEQTQSDCITQAVSRTCSFLDTFPPLEARWTPRFEESIQARVGRLTLAARPDLLLGRPRGDGKQTMFLCDFKSGDLREEHLLEARYYALVSTIRHGCAPFRSTVLSLASGEWTDPDVMADDLMEVAQLVVRGVRSYVEVLTDQRDVELRAGMHCTWCPAKSSCEAHEAWRADGSPAGAAVMLQPSRRPAQVVAATVAPKPVAVPVLVGASEDDDPFAV